MLPGGGGGGRIHRLMFSLHHPKTPQAIKLKLSYHKDTSLIYQFKVALCTGLNHVCYFPSSFSSHSTLFCRRVTSITCSTCMLDSRSSSLLCFFLTLCYFQPSIEGKVEKTSYLYYGQAPVEMIY